MLLNASCAALLIRYTVLEPSTMTVAAGLSAPSPEPQPPAAAIADRRGRSTSPIDAFESSYVSF